MTKPYTIAALRTCATQSSIKALVWHPFRVSSRVPTLMFVDTGASGGNYTSIAFIEVVERASYYGKSIKFSAGKGYLGAGNPSSTNVPPISVIGSCKIPLVFPPIDRVPVKPLYW